MIVITTRTRVAFWLIVASLLAAVAFGPQASPAPVRIGDAIHYVDGTAVAR